jgi:predicted MFS family arabinose efflux permease
VGKPLFDIGARTYVSERVPYRSRARSLGILELSWAGGFLIGAPLTGWLIDLWSWEAPFWVFGTIALIALGGVALVLEPSDSHHTTDTERRAQSNSAIVPVLVAVTIAGFTLELVFVTIGACSRAPSAQPGRSRRGGRPARSGRVRR